MEDLLSEAEAELTRKLESTHWKHVHEKRGVVVKRLDKGMDHDAPVTAWLCEAEYPGHLELDSFVKHYQQFEGRNQWDSHTMLPTSRTLRVISSSGSTAETSVGVSITAAALGGVISSREFVDLRHWRIEGNGQLLVCCGVSLPDYEYAASGVRGHNYASGMRVERRGDVWLLRSLWHSDLKGWLPRSTVDSAMPAAIVACFSGLREHLSSAVAK